MIPLHSNQLVVPGHQRIRRDDRGDVVQYLAPQTFGFLRQTSALGIGEAQALLAEHLPQYAILFLQVLNDIKLLTVYPTSKDNEQVLQEWKPFEHSGAALYQPLPAPL